MSSASKWIVGLVAVTAVGGSIAQAAPVLVVDNQSQQVQTPAAPAVGFSYVPSADGASSKLSVYTNGFLFCGNPGGGTTTPASLTVLHEDQTLANPAKWAFPTATHIPAITYNGTTLAINAGQPTSLTCLGTDVSGAVPAGIRESVFDNGYDSAKATNFNHLVNWVAPEGFGWTTEEWTDVPVDPCNPGANDIPRTVEDVACAAVTGVRNSSATQGPRRAPTIWTATDGTTFTYLFRVDARWGLPALGTKTPMALPDQQSADSPNSGATIAFTVQDAFDTTFLDGTAGGEYCLMTSLPATLDASVCNGSNTYQLNGQPLSYSDSVRDPSGGNGDVASYYMAVKRPVHGGHASLLTPVVAVSVLVERAAVLEGADQFSGDDIAFGFMPASNGFPWMSGQ